MFATYSVPGTDIVFACVMCALLMLWTYIIGRTNQLVCIKADIEDFKYHRTWLCEGWQKTEDELLMLQALHDLEVDMRPAAIAYELQQQRRELTKKHRLALAKYKAKCDARLHSQFEFMRSTIETQQANHLMELSDHKRPDFSLLLSK